MNTTYAPKHMKKSEPKAAPKLDYEQAWRIVYAAECNSVGTPDHKAIKAARESLERLMEPKAAPKAQKAAPKPKPAPKADAPANWWDEWFAQPWVKATYCKEGSCIVKMHCEGSHGAELRAAGWQYSRKGMPIGGGKKAAGYWWAYKDATKAKERGERYLANKAAKAESAA